MNNNVAITIATSIISAVIVGNFFKGFSLTSLQSSLDIISVYFGG